MDADGSGAYDAFPISSQRSLPVTRPAEALIQERRMITAEDLRELIHEVKTH